MNRAALFCDGTVDYRIPVEPDPGDSVKLRFRTAKDEVKHVCLICGGSERKELTKTGTQGRFDYYETSLLAGEDTLDYYFEITPEEETEAACVYDRRGVSCAPDPRYAFCIIPGFHVPEWAKGAVMYQIFVDRFCNGDPSNDVVTDEYVYLGAPVTRVTDWNAKLSVFDVDRFYGGDLAGVMNKLDYLKSLKVEVIYLNPIFVSPSNHKYDCQDYEHVDPHYGAIVKDADGLVYRDSTDNHEAEKYSVRTTDPDNLAASDALLARLIEEIHARGMRVILDGVFNHCGSFNKWLDREKIYERSGGYQPGAYGSADSPYRDFFRFRDRKGWPDNDTYEGWWNHETLPKLNYEGSKVLYRYILDVARKWLSPPYNADGWRLDVAADLGHSPEFNHRFWKDFRRAVREVRPDALILSEHYGDPAPWLGGDEWDTVMNYDAFMDPLTWFLTGMEKHSDKKDEELRHDGEAFMRAMTEAMGRMPSCSIYAAMNELSNHDHSRFLTRTNATVGRLHTKGAAAAAEGISYGLFRAAVVVQMTWPGAPTIYYGDEAGVCGWTDPDNRRPYPWGHENLELIEFHKYMTGIRKRNPAFRNGSLKPLLAGHGIIAYGRFSAAGRGVVLVNSEDYSQYVEIPVWETGIEGDSVTRIMVTDEERYNAGKVSCPVEDGILRVEIGPRAAMIFEEPAGTEKSA